MNTIGVGGQNFQNLLHRYRFQRGFMFGVLIVAALLAFEIFNYTTTDYALSDLLGDLDFAGIRWATILAVAFCGIDFAGIARLFTPEDGGNEHTETWYLFGAWLLAATMNAMLTWWGISLAILNHETLGTALVERQTLLRMVPIFIAIMVWLIRVMIIGTFSIAGDRLFSQADTGYRPVRVSTIRGTARNIGSSQRPSVASQVRSSIPATSSFRSSSRTFQSEEAEPDMQDNPNSRTESGYRNGNNLNRNSGYNRPEPTYHPAIMSGQQETKSKYTRR
jgi:hypothetical protein